jgi:hypothetical protein
MTGDAKARGVSGAIEAPLAAQVLQQPRDEHPAPARTEAMTDDFTDLEKLAREATPGPWAADEDELLVLAGDDRTVWICRTGCDADRDFIAAANPARVLALCAELTRLRGALENIRDNSDGWQRDAANDALAKAQKDESRG